MFEGGISLTSYLMMSEYYLDLRFPISYPRTNILGGLYAWRRSKRMGK